MTLNKRLAAAVVAAGIATGVLAAPSPASAADGILPRSQPCPEYLNSWTFYAGTYNEVATGLYRNYSQTDSCGYIAETFEITGSGLGGTVYRNYRVVIVKNFIYPIVIY